MVKAKAVLKGLGEDTRKTMNLIGTDFHLERMREAQRGFDLADKGREHYQALMKAMQKEKAGDPAADDNDDATSAADVT